MMKGKGQGGRGEGRLVCLIKPGLCMFVAADERGRDTIYTCLIYDREVAIFATGTSVGLPGCVCVYMCVCSFAWSPVVGVRWNRPRTERRESRESVEANPTFSRYYRCAHVRACDRLVRVSRSRASCARATSLTQLPYTIAGVSVYYCSSPPILPHPRTLGYRRATRQDGWPF